MRHVEHATIFVVFLSLVVWLAACATSPTSTPTNAPTPAAHSPEASPTTEAEAASAAPLAIEMTPWLTLQAWQVSLDGRPADFPVELPPNARVDITLQWQMASPPGGVYQIDAQLRHVLGTAAWQTLLPLPASPPTDGVLTQSLTFDLPASLPEGAYALVLTVLRTDTADGVGLPVGAAQTLMRFKVPLDQAADAPPETEPLARFGDAITLVGVHLPTEARVFESVVVLARWRVDQPIDDDWTGLLSIVGPCQEAQCDAATVTKIEERPLRGLYPTTVWSPGEQVVTTMQLAVPPTVMNGRYEVRLGWKETTSGARIPVEPLAEHVQVTDGAVRFPLTIIVQESEETNE
nr:hypothetical protein [Ardenticatena sp.]